MIVLVDRKAAFRATLHDLDTLALRDMLAVHRERIAFGSVRAAVLAGFYRAELARRTSSNPIAEALTG